MSAHRIDQRIRDFVRFLYFKRIAKQVQIAKFLGVSQSTIHRIISE